MADAPRSSPGRSSATPEKVSGPANRQVFACRRCGSCCRGRGGVWLTRGEIPEVAEALGLTEKELREFHLTPVSSPSGRRGTDKGERWEVGIGLGGYCLFYREGCLVHEVKPSMCRLWPFFRHPLSGERAFLEAAGHCPGLSDLDYPGFLAAYESFKRSQARGGPGPKAPGRPRPVERRRRVR